MFKKVITTLLLASVSFFSIADETKDNKTDYQKIADNIVIGYNVKQDHEFIFPEKESVNYEVIYFFSYGCPHCFEYKPYFQEWKNYKKDDVSVHYVPVSFQKGWENLAKAYIIADELKLKDFDNTIFEHIHKNKYRIANMSDLRDFFAEFYNVETNVFNLLYNSMETNAKIERYNKLADDFEIMGTPNVLLITKENQVYLTSPSKANNELNSVVTIEFLIKKDRKLNNK